MTQSEVKPWEHPEIASSHRGQYVLGYILSIGLSGASLLLVKTHALSPLGLLLVIALIAAVTLLAQLRLLFHLDLSEHQLWNTLTLTLNVPLLMLTIGLTAWMFRTLYLQVMTPDHPMSAMSGHTPSQQQQPYTHRPVADPMQ